MSEMANASAGRVQQAGQTAKQEVSATAGQAKQAAGEVAGTAAEQVKSVTGEAREQVGAVAGDLRERVTEQAESQVQRGAEALRQWSDDLAGLVDKADGDSPAKSLVAQAADRGHHAADYLDRQGVEGLVEDLQGFARRRPGAFLGGAVLAGFAVGRLAKAGSKAGGSGPGRAARTPYPVERSLPGDAAGPELPEGEV
ncbi:hypothetical protein ACSNOJ_13090 [Streptomyces sp. URMC 128]|uniref:hypothetical protein n=1 Tax=Streptomyces sp. URMC 128 TaxID=3423404 RepID=UPI003F1C9161